MATEWRRDRMLRVGAADRLRRDLAETERALSDHELIKVRVHGADRSKRAEALAQLTEATQAIEVQRIGKIAVLYKKNLKPNEKLSNLKRFA